MKVNSFILMTILDKIKTFKDSFWLITNNQLQNNVQDHGK